MWQEGSNSVVTQQVVGMVVVLGVGVSVWCEGWGRWQVVVKEGKHGRQCGVVAGSRNV